MQITVNEPGARTINDSRPMKIDGQNVYVVIGGGTASLMVAGRIVAEQAAMDMTTTAAQDWAVSYRDEQAQADELHAADWFAAQTAAFADEITGQVADEAAVEEATNVDAVYAGAVESVRDAGALLDKQADKMAATTPDAPYRFRNSMGKARTLPRHDPRHPLNAAPVLKRRAAVLMAWTAQDEQAYGQYVSDGICDTDGWYAPLDRDAWKGALGA